MPEPQPRPADQRRALLPPEGYRQLVAALQEYAPRARAGHRASIPDGMLVV